jgi:hypothetical protein
MIFRNNIPRLQGGVVYLKSRRLPQNFSFLQDFKCFCPAGYQKRIDKPLFIMYGKMGLFGGNSMKKFWGPLSFLVILAGCAGVPGELPVNDSQENTVFSDSGAASFQNDEYFLIGILVEDLQETLKIWSIPDSQGIPKLPAITKVKRNEPISVFLAYAVKKGGINMTYDFKTLRPDGTFSVNAYKGLEIADGNPPDNLIYEARQLPTIIFDAADSFGKYQFHISVFDNNNPITNFVLEFELIE